MAVEGLVTIPSRFGVAETLDRIAAVLAEKGITIFARVDHGAGAQTAGLPLRPTELLIFGSPKAGTPLMQAGQTAGIDLPLKMLAWEDAEGRVWLAYIEASWVSFRHGLGPAAEPASNAINKVLADIARSVAA